MSITILQKPSDIQPAQSPIVFSVTTSGSQAYTSSEFQYTANLYVWDGLPNNSGSYVYQARKYPNVSGSGIFDFSRMINSTITRLAASTPQFTGKFYKVDFGFQYESGSTYVTQSGGLTSVTCSAGGTLFVAYDGYATFPEQINTSLEAQDVYWPLMTDMGSVTQSCLITDAGTLGIIPHGLTAWVGANDTNSFPINSVRVAITASYTNGTTLSDDVGLGPSATVTSSFNFINAVIPAFPADPGWATFYDLIPTNNLEKYTLKFMSGSVQLGQTFNYEVVCPHYYEPVRIAWKNRYGAFDWLNFYKRHNETFNTEQRLYQPQLGTWGAQTLTYDQFQTTQQRYIVDATQTLECNTDWLEQGWNNLFKQMMVSDEIYWVYDRQPYPPIPVFTEWLVKPLTIQTNSLQFKTGVNNKLIQYTITFDIGQPYKLLL
jgi:hypothetical protein